MINFFMMGPVALRPRRRRRDASPGAGVAAYWVVPVSGTSLGNSIIFSIQLEENKREQDAEPKDPAHNGRCRFKRRRIPK
jgi:hypothetical protein